VYARVLNYRNQTLSNKHIYTWQHSFAATHSFVHFGHFYNAPSSPILLRGDPDCSTENSFRPFRGFTPKRTGNCR